jgi:hypothetical protein
MVAAEVGEVLDIVFVLDPYKMADVVVPERRGLFV